jgi:hypothetical protein
MTINNQHHTDLELALMVLLGYFGNGSTRKTKLGSRYKSVQNIVDQICKGVMPDSDAYTRLMAANKNISSVVANIITGG